MKITKRKALVVGVLLVVVIGGGVYAHSHSKKQAVRYVTGQVSQDTMYFTVTGNGSLVADKVAKVSPQVSGVVSEVMVKNGDTVHAGDTLMTLTNNQLDSQLSKSYGSYLQAKQSVASANASLLQAEANQTTVDNNPNSTVDQQNIAAAQVTAAQAGLAAARQNQTAAGADYDVQAQNANDRTVTAPIDGTITSLNVNPGDTVSAGSVSTSSSSSSSTSSSSGTSPITIEDLNTLEASVQINEVDVSKVKTGDKATVTFDAVDGLTATGKVIRIDAVGTSTQGVVTYTAVVALDSVDSRLHPGMSVSAVITTNTIENALHVPTSAIKGTSGNQYVETLGAHNQTTQVPVQTGDSNDTDTQITSGLTAGESIITQTIKPTTSSTSSSSTSSLFRLQGGGGGGTFRSGATSGAGRGN